MKNKIRVIIADDHAIIRAGFQQMLEGVDDITLVGATGDGDAVLPTLLEIPCDVLVLDLSLPNKGGVEIVEQIKQHAPHVGICVLSMYPEDQLALHLLKNGVLAYLNKTRAVDEVLSAIRAVAQGRRYITHELSDLVFNDQGDGLPHSRLTSREYQVFFLIIEGHTVGEIASDLSLSPSTISNHVAKIKEKLGAPSIGGVLRYASRMGLIK